MKGKKHTTEDKIRILRAADGGKSIVQIAALPGAIPQGGSRQAQDADAGSPPGIQAVGDHGLDHLLLVPRAHNYFSFTNRSTRFSSSESASIFFSSVFSRSSSLSRLASLTSIMPNCLFQRWKVCSEMFFSLQNRLSGTARRRRAQWAYQLGHAKANTGRSRGFEKGASVNLALMGQWG